MRLLTRGDIARLLTVEDHLQAVETAFRLLGQGKAELPPPLHVAAGDGGFHAKAAALPLVHPYVAVKVNGNFPANQARHGLPTVQGAILLFDGENGYPLALLDSIEITLARTAAATALAARHLARPDSRTVTICGCGQQGRIQLEYIARVLPIERAWAWDTIPEQATTFALEITERLGIGVRIAGDLRRATLASDIIVTCTTARAPFLGMADVAPGTFIAAVGADNPNKQELEPELLAAVTVYADIFDQCLSMGDLHHAQGVKIAGELGDLVTGRKAGRTTPDEIIVFDSTGVAVQDVAAAARAYERAVARGVGQEVAL